MSDPLKNLCQRHLEEVMIGAAQGMADAIDSAIAEDMPDILETMLGMTIVSRSRPIMSESQTPGLQRCTAIFDAAIERIREYQRKRAA